MIVFQDQAVLRNIESIVGHSNPFTQDECEAITSLKVSLVRDCNDLQHCPNIEQLELFACDIQDLHFVAHLPNLESLTVLCTPISDVSALQQCKKLGYVDISFTAVEELDCLLELPLLKNGRFVGNPLSEQSDTLFRNLTGERGVFELSSQEAWQYSKQIRALGLAMDFSGFGGSKQVLVKPGIPEYTKGNCDFLTDQEYKIEFLLFELMQLQSANISPSIIFNILSSEEKNSPRRSISLYSQRNLGTAKDAQDWLQDSTLPQAEIKHLITFIDRFPELIFFSENKRLFDDLEETYQITLPNWYTEARSILAFVQPNHDIAFQFNDDLDSALEDVWFKLDKGNAGGALNSASFTNFKPFVFASSLSGHLVLAINIQDDKYGIYLLDLENIIENPTEDNDISLLFASYGEFLSQIEAIKFPNGQIHS